jgi:hypothetical protein
LTNGFLLTISLNFNGNVFEVFFRVLQHLVGTRCEGARVGWSSRGRATTSGNGGSDTEFSFTASCKGEKEE